VLNNGLRGKLVDGSRVGHEKYALPTLDPPMLSPTYAIRIYPHGKIVARHLHLREAVAMASIYNRVMEEEAFQATVIPEPPVNLLPADVSVR
jgi:hypothetical protein